MPESRHILVVEDDPHSAQIVVDCLRGDGYAVSHVTDGLAALHAFDEQSPDLVTLDLGLPTVTGFRLIEVFKRRRPSVPVVIVSGMAFEEAEETAQHGANDYLVKPFDLDNLLKTVRYLLRDTVSRPDTAQTVNGQGWTLARRTA